MAEQAESFVVDLPEETLSDLRERLQRARIPTDFANEDWSYGTNGGYLRELLDYWLHQFDWRAREREINAFSHYRVELDGIPIHFIHEQGKGPRPIPLVLTHGWPWTFWDYQKVIRPLTDPGAFGGDPADAFDVVVPSLPGFIFSTPLRTTGINWWRTADLWVKLMRDVLGYERFGAHGGDWGMAVTAQLGHKYAEHLIGIHTLGGGGGDGLFHIFGGERPWDLGGPISAQVPADLRSALIAHQKKFASHVAVHVLDPQTLATALHDSPVGLCAWILERRRARSDCGGDVERRFTKDELLTTMTLYWATDSFVTSVRYYHEAAAYPWKPAHDRSPLIEVPVGGTLFLPDAPPGAEAALAALGGPHSHFRNVRKSGGHFAPAEEPEAVVEDIRSTFRTLR